MCVGSHWKLCITVMRNAGKFFLFGILAFYCLAGCQPIPKPFQPLFKTEYSTPPAFDSKLGIFLAGVDNADASFEGELISALVVALTAHGIVASTEVANQGSYLLVGDLSSAADARISLSWQIIAADGNVVGLFEQTAANRETSLVQLAGDAAQRTASLLYAKEPLNVELQVASLPAVVLRAVDGAPGDGRISLTSAMRSALVERSVQVLTTELDVNALLILGSVMIRVDNEGESVEVHWSLIDGEGKELGSVSQNNTVPFGALDGEWGDIAHAIADGGADGVITLLREVQHSKFIAGED